MPGSRPRSWRRTRPAPAEQAAARPCREPPGPRAGHRTRPRLARRRAVAPDRRRHGGRDPRRQGGAAPDRRARRRARRHRPAGQRRRQPRRPRPLGLRIAVRDGRPARVFQWAELGRASHLLNPPARPPDRPGTGRSSSGTCGRSWCRSRAAQGRACRRAAAPPSGHLGADHPRPGPQLDDRCRQAVRRSAERRGRRGPARRGRAARVPRGRRHAARRDHCGRTGQAAAARRRSRRHRAGGQTAVRTAQAVPGQPGRRERASPHSRCSSTPRTDSSALLLGGCRSWPTGRWWSCRPGRCNGCRGRCFPRASGRPVSVTPSAALLCGGTAPPSAAGRVTVVAGPDLPGGRAEATPSPICTACRHLWTARRGRRGDRRHRRQRGSPIWPRTARSVRTTRSSPPSSSPTGHSWRTTWTGSPRPGDRRAGGVRHRPPGRAGG